MARPELRVEYVSRDALDEHRKKIEREGTERLVSIVPDGGEFRVTTVSLAEAKRETR